MSSLGHTRQKKTKNPNLTNSDWGKYMSVKLNNLTMLPRTPMNKISYQTLKSSPAEAEVVIPFKTQTFPIITLRLMLQGTKKNTKELPAHIKTPVTNVAFKGPWKKRVKTKRYVPRVVCFEEKSLCNSVNYSSVMFVKISTESFCKTILCNTTENRGHGVPVTVCQ